MKIAERSAEPSFSKSERRGIAPSINNQKPASGSESRRRHNPKNVQSATGSKILLLASSADARVVLGCPVARRMGITVSYSGKSDLHCSELERYLFWSGDI